MTALIWDEIGDRIFESGVSKGVFYDQDGHGVSWNGLTSVEVNTPVEVQPIYFDGLKFNDFVTFGNFAGDMKAFTYPDEFLPYEGFLQDQRGFYVSNQPTGRFGLSYRTNVGSDLDSDLGYKLHVLYNITAVPTQRDYQTLATDIQPIVFEWNISAIPEYIEGFRPTAHIIFDSRHMDPWLLADIEEILYGDEDTDAYLPSLKSLSTFIRKWDRLIITDNNDGTWTASSMQEGQIVMTDSETFEITADTAEYLDPDTYNIWSSDKNEEDIWLP
jgi:hypothetical protein